VFADVPWFLLLSNQTASSSNSSSSSLYFSLQYTSHLNTSNSALDQPLRPFIYISRRLGPAQYTYLYVRKKMLRKNPDIYANDYYCHYHYSAQQPDRLKVYCNCKYVVYHIIILRKFHYPFLDEGLQKRFNVHSHNFAAAHLCTVQQLHCAQF